MSLYGQNIEALKIFFQKSALPRLATNSNNSQKNRKYWMIYQIWLLDEIANITALKKKTLIYQYDKCLI